MQNELVERFFRYAAITSQSDGKAAAVPSTEGQRELARLLASELSALGLTDVSVSDKAVLTAKLPARLPEGFAGSLPAVGFVAHLDTVDMSLSPDVKPQVIKAYPGGDLCLNAERDIWIRLAEHPELERYIGEDVIVGDGTSVLGADNKAAIAAIMTAIAVLQRESARYHGDLYFAFVPDEEIGLRGAKSLELDKFPVDFAYTLDCCEIGEVVYETFNAGNAAIAVQGVTAHPMSSKGVLVNPLLVLNEIINHFDRVDTPECTEGKEGYFWVKNAAANPSRATLQIDIRDHNKEKYEARKKFIADLIEFVRARNPKARITCDITDTYGNIADAVTEKNKSCIDYLYEAMQRLEIEPKTIAMRGGTDGSCLSARGILTPNFFTGGHNFHSNCEFLPVGPFEKSCRMILEILTLVYRDGKKA